MEERATAGDGALSATDAVQLIWSGDANLFAIVRLSLAVTLAATLLAAVLGMPLGAFAALVRFPGRELLVVVLNAFIGLPPVVVGLVVFLLLSRAGPLGDLGLLFTPTAMVVAQTVLITPIVAALTRQVIEDLWAEYREEFQAMQVDSVRQHRWTLLWDVRFSLVTHPAGRLRPHNQPEVGAVDHCRRQRRRLHARHDDDHRAGNLKGNLALAVGLGHDPH